MGTVRQGLEATARSLICDWLMGLEILEVGWQVRILPQVDEVDIYK